MSKPLIRDKAIKDFVELATRITDHRFYILKPKEIKVILEYLVLLLIESESKNEQRNNNKNT